MRILYVVRHAKSSWDNPSLTDFQRPLNNRGEKDAPRIGKRLHEKEVHPGIICSSPAVRALTTAKIIAGFVGYNERNIREEPKLYHATEGTILEVVRSFDDRFETAMIAGHNPGFTDFVNELLDETIGNIPTAGVVAGRLNIDSWKEAAWGCGKMKFYEYPKKER